MKAFGRAKELWLCPTWLNTVSYFLTLDIYLFRVDFIYFIFSLYTILPVEVDRRVTGFIRAKWQLRLEFGVHSSENILWLVGVSEEDNGSVTSFFLLYMSYLLHSLNKERKVKLETEKKVQKHFLSIYLYDLYLIYTHTHIFKEPFIKRFLQFPSE